MTARLKGAKLMLKLDTPAVDYQAELTAWRITNDEKDADVTTFADVDSGDDRKFLLTGTAVQSTDSASFWSYVWANAGAEDITFTLAPHGNAVASADQPHIIGTLTIGPEPELGVEAGKDNTGTFEFSWELDAKPTLDRGV